MVVAGGSTRRKPNVHLKNFTNINIIYNIIHSLYIQEARASDNEEGCDWVAD